MGVSKWTPPPPPQPPAIRVVNEDRKPRKVPEPHAGNLMAKLCRIEDKMDEVTTRMDKQFLLLAGMLDKFMEAQSADAVADFALRQKGFAELATDIEARIVEGRNE